MEYLIGLVLGSLAYAMWKSKQAGNALGLLSNLDTKEKLLNKDKQENENDNKIDDLEKQLKDLENE